MIEDLARFVIANPNAVRTSTRSRLHDWNGGQGRKLVERSRELNEVVVVAEIEAYPEPKTLTAAELLALKRELGTNQRVAYRIGGTEGFVRDGVS